MGRCLGAERPALLILFNQLDGPYEMSLAVILFDLNAVRRISIVVFVLDRPLKQPAHRVVEVPPDFPCAPFEMRPKKVGVVGKDDPTVCPIDSALDLALSSLEKAGIDAVPVRLRPTDFQSSQIKTALTPFENDVDVLLVRSDPLVSANVQYLIPAAHELGMKTMHEFREPVDQHLGDRSHRPSFAGPFIKATDMVDQILGGTSPGEIDVFQPDPKTFEDAP
jgi:hypothetical protein